MSLGGFDIPTNFKVFEAKDVLGEAQVYGIPNETLGDQSAHFLGIHPCRPSLIAESFNKNVPFTNGTLKRVMLNNFDAGGSLGCTFRGSIGGDVAVGTFNGNGIQFFDVEITFVAGEIIGIFFGRSSSSGTWVFIGAVTVDFDEPNDFYQQLFSSWAQTGAASHGFLPPCGDNYNGEGNNPADEAENQFRAPRAGTIRDMNFYGLSPVGVDFVASMQARVNGSVESDQNLLESASLQESLFTGIDVPFVEGDLLGMAVRSANNGATVQGVGGFHIEWDEL